MPVRNEADFIAQSLGAVIAQDYPHSQMEILIADGMSDDNTRKIIQEVAATSDIEIKIIDNPKCIVPTGFNAALAAAEGEVIVRVDGHTIIASDYVCRCVETLQRTKADNVGGRMNATAAGDVGEAIALATSSAFGVGGARFHYSNKEELVDTVYMGAWPRSVFDRIGGFDEEFVRNQDDEFNYRLRENGGQILLNPVINSTYFSRSSLSTLTKQYYQYGVYKVRVMQKHPRQMRPRQFAPLILVSGVMGGVILAPIHKWLYRGWLISIAFYGSANFAVSIWTASKFGWRHLKLLPIVFATLHFSYGLGFLRGLIKFRDRWSNDNGKVTD